MFDRHIGTARPADAGHDAASFRARLMARRNTRPQSTMAIDAGIVYRPGSATSEHARRAAEAVRDEIRRRRPEPVAAAAPVVVEKAPPRPAPSDAELASVVEEVAARKAEEDARREAARRTAPAAVVVPAATKESRKAVPETRAAVAEAEAPLEVATRLGDISQLAFAGLAVLGLAGLSLMAAEHALKGPDKDSGSAAGKDTEQGAGSGAETGAQSGALAPDLKPGGASAVALAAASPEEPKAWFNYQGVADALAARKAELEAAEAAAKVEAEKEARLRAANAIAEAEAARVAEQQQAAADAAEQARLAEEAERQRLAEAEAARVAELEAERQARRETERRAAAELEAQRLADLEAKRKAEAELEAQRLADLEAQRLAKLEAQRRAAEDAARLEAFQQAKAAEAEKLRLAALSAQQETDAAEARRLEAAAAKARADRLAAEKLLAEQEAAGRTAPKAEVRQVSAPAPSAKPTVAPTPKPQKIVFTPYDGPVPQPASYKPVKPYVQQASTAPSDTPVVRKAPATLRANTANVRTFDTRTPEGFLASRTDRTATGPMTTDDLDMVKAAFRSILDKGADGSKQAIMTADGRALTILIERTVTREMGQSTVRTVTYTPSPDAVARVVAEQVPVTVSVMCRDISYAFAGQEHGRFAACLSPDGAWTMARATDVVEVTTASLPNSAG